MLWFYYTYKNLVYYRKARPVYSNIYVRFSLKEELEKLKNENYLLEDKKVLVQELNYRLTTKFLATVGLKIIESESDKVPWYIPLSKIQKDYISMVGKKGYKVGIKKS
jgi:hypothetical protein